VLDVHGDVDTDDLAAVALDGNLLHGAATLPLALQETCGGVPCWLVLPMGRDRPPSAVLLIGFDDADAARSTRPRLAPITDDATLALDNARLFEGTRSRALDAARRQLASDLHDGVAQSLAHLRMELELLAMRDPAVQLEAERLSKVAGSALSDLRRTISGLRLSREDALAARLERHLREVRTPHGPRIDLLVLDDPPLDPDTIEEVFRVAQEAVSNAMRHAEANEVTVLLDRIDGDLLLRVEDDGIGLGPATAHVSEGGVGLASMRERASRLQAHLEVGAVEHGGTRVSLRVPSRPRARQASDGLGVGA
jgi:signal transduction histidine kinase